LSRFYLESEMATTVTARGRVTLPRSVREAAGIRPGDRVTLRALPEGGVLVEREAATDGTDLLVRLKDIIERKPLKDGAFGAKSTDEIMSLLRGED